MKKQSFKQNKENLNSSKDLTDCLNPIFLSRMKDILEDDYSKFISSLNQPEQKAIYVNENKIDINNFKKATNFSIEQIPYEQAGFYVNEKLGKHPLHCAGAFYVQDASAMFTVNSLKFNGDEMVLDMCAAPGGKSIQIANRLTKGGTLVSNEIVPSRCKILYSNIERMGLKNVIITNDNPQNLALCYANTFDVCLVDAPCSGEGMFRRGEEYIKPWNENLQDMCAARQQEILNCADKCLKVGGKIIYSTCTYSIKENEEVVSSFLKTHNYKLINIQAPFARGINMPETVRIYPHNNRGEGQFVAVLQKMSSNDETTAAGNLKLKQTQFSKEFFKINTNLDIKEYEFNGNVYYVPNIDLLKKGVKYYAIGVFLGEANKIFKPNHFLFSAFGNFFKTKLELSAGEIEKYLKGEDLQPNLADCYGIVSINGCVLGGFKISAGKFKNLYPKGLRI